MLTNIPSEIEFLEFFESEPLESAPKDGWWCYQVENNSIGVRFSFNIFEKSVQTVLLYKNKEISTVSFEDCIQIKLEKYSEKEILIALFGNVDKVFTKLQLVLRPDIEINWHHLSD